MINWVYHKQKHSSYITELIKAFTSSAFPNCFNLFAHKNLRHFNLSLFTLLIFNLSLICINSLPILLYLKSIFVRTVLTFNASDSDLAPSAPILLDHKYIFVITVLTFNASDSDLAPSAPILLDHKYIFVITVLTF